MYKDLWNSQDPPTTWLLKNVPKCDRHIPKEINYVYVEMHSLYVEWNIITHQKNENENHSKLPPQSRRPFIPGMWKTARILCIPIGTNMVQPP